MSGVMGGMSIQDHKDELFGFAAGRNDSPENRERYRIFLAKCYGVLTQEEITDILQAVDELESIG